MTEKNTGTAFPLEDRLSVLIGFALLMLMVVIGRFPAPAYGWNSAQDFLEKVCSASNLTTMAGYALAFFALLATVHYSIHRSFREALMLSVTVVTISQAALLMAGSGWSKSLNMEAVIFSLLIGLVVNHTAPARVAWQEKSPTEFLVKTGLILLGSGIIFSDILKAGMLGMLQALLVVVAVWYFAFRICRWLKIDEELSLMLSSAVSICGVSAAIATAGAIRGNPKKLSFVVAVVLVTAVPMMVAMPLLADAMGLSPAVTGAWLGGTIDTTGAVVAADSLAGESALQIGTIVKFSQNVLLGLAALGISIYWTYRKAGQEPDEKPSLSLIWQRFPKFVLGFVAASALFSFLLSPELVSEVKDGLKNIQNQLFVMAFSAIGLETRITDLWSREHRPAVAAFLTAQVFNVLFTLLVAWFLFQDYSH